MNKIVVRVTGVALFVIAAVGISAALFAQDSKPALSVEPARPAANPEIVSKTIPLTSDLSVTVQLYLSDSFPVTMPLASGSRSVRIVSLTTDYQVHNLSLHKGQVFGPTDAQGAETFYSTAGTIDLANAKMLAAQILALPAAGEFAPDKVGPFKGTVRPAEGKTWAMVTSEADLDITFKAK